MAQPPRFTSFCFLRQTEARSPNGFHRVLVGLCIVRRRLGRGSCAWAGGSPRGAVTKAALPPRQHPPALDWAGICSWRARDGSTRQQPPLAPPPAVRVGAAALGACLPSRCRLNRSPCLPRCCSHAPAHPWHDLEVGEKAPEILNAGGWLTYGACAGRHPQALAGAPWPRCTPECWSWLTSVARPALYLEQCMHAARVRCGARRLAAPCCPSLLPPVFPQPPTRLCSLASVCQ